MHIEKRFTKGKTKYFLSHSYREGKKVHKFRKYLGLDLPEEKLEERRKIAEKLILEEIHKYDIIKDPLSIDLPLKEIDRIAQLEKTIPLRIRHLSEKEWKAFSSLFAYNTNAIEGSKLKREEVKSLLYEDKWPDKSKEDIAEAYGVDNAIRLIRQTKTHISIELIKKIHKTVFKNSKSFAGKFRRKGEDVVVIDDTGKIIDEVAPQTRINHLLRQLAEWYDTNRRKYPALILAAVIHNQFENIHPFADGNGRVGRILLNNTLIKHNFPPLNIDLKNKEEYYHAIREYINNQDLKPTIDLFLKEYRSMNKQLQR